MIIIENAAPTVMENLLIFWRQKKTALKHPTLKMSSMIFLL